MLDVPARPTTASAVAAPPRVAWRLAVVVAAALGMAAVSGLVARATGGPRDPWPGWLLVAVGGVVLVVLELVGWRWRRSQDTRRAMRAWTTLTVAALVLLGGTVAAAALPSGRDAVLDAAYFTASPFFAVGILLLPTPRMRDRWETVLDALDGIAAAVGVAVATVWLLPDDVGHGLTAPELAHVLAVTGTVGVLTFVVTRQRRPGGLPVRQLELVIAATALVTTGSVAAYRASVGVAVFGTVSAGLLFVGGCLVGALALLRPPVEIEGPRDIVRRELWATLLPSAAIAAGLLSIAWYATQPVPLPFVVGTPMVILVFVVVAVFLVVRVLGEQQARRLRSAAAGLELESVAKDAWFRTMTADTTDAVALVDLGGRVVVTSPAAERQLSADAADLAGRPLVGRLVVPIAVWQSLLARAARSPGVAALADAVIGGDEGARPVELRVTALTDGAGLQGYVVTFRDVSEQRALADALARQQATDGLTGLRNRVGSLADCAPHLAAAGSGRCAVVALDIERFGLVNDTLGHDSGDELLRRMAALVESACGGVVVGRVGGDEFAVLLVVADTESSVDEQVAVSVGHLRGLVDGLSHLRGDGLPMTVHVGYAVASTPGVLADELLRSAEVAVESARGRPGVEPVRFDPVEHALRLADVGLEAELRAAIAADGLVLHYQPVVDLVSGRPLGVEALVRWPHPTAGLLGPDRFVPLAERSGLSRPLGTWVLGRALGDVAALRAAAGGDGFRVAVNVSAQEVTSVLPSVVSTALDEAGAQATDLVVEVTESALFSRPDDAAPALEALRALGVTVALDDFGTGYSSLALLTRVPVDILKIDRSFVARVQDQGQEWALVRGVLQLCQSLRLRSVAEGVETEGQADLLRAMGCDEAQGYLFARPMPLDEACGWLRAHDSGSTTLRG